MAVTATGFITDAELKDAITAALNKVEVDALDSAIWTANIARRNLGAYNQIVSAWVRAGFALSNVQGWDLGPLYQENLALYECLIKQNPNSEQVGEWRRELDYWRQQLKDLVEDEALIVGGALVALAADPELYELHTQNWNG